jgi:nucleoside-diphosphate-sugar epimerase
VVAVRALLRHSVLGELRSIKVVHGGKFHWPIRSNAYFSRGHGGLLLNMGVHYLDMIEDWVGPLQPIDYKDDYGGGAEANFQFRLATKSGASVELKLSVTHELDNGLTIEGSEGCITADVDRFDSCIWMSKILGITAQLKTSRPFQSGPWPLDFVGCFAEQLYEFTEVIKGGVAPRVDAPAAIASQNLIDWAYGHREPLRGIVSASRVDRPRLDATAVVVTGGTGFVGGKLVERLAELCINDIRVVVRSARTSANVSRFPVNRVFTDILSPPELSAAVKDARYVFHLAHGTSKTTIEGTRNIVEAGIAEGVESIVVVSTATVFGHPRGVATVTINENFPYRPALGEYGRSKAAAERYALSRARSSAGGTRIVVLNPSAVYGPLAPLFVELPARMAREGSFSWINEGAGKFNYIYVENLIDAMLLAAQSTATHGERFIISDGCTTVRAFLSPILGSRAESMRSFTKADLINLEKKDRPGMRGFLKALSNDEMMRTLNGMAGFSFAKRFVLNRMPGAYSRMQQLHGALQIRSSPAVSQVKLINPPVWLADIFGPINIEYSSEKAQRLLGWKPAISLEVGLTESAKWLSYLGLGGFIANPVGEQVGDGDGGLGESRLCTFS